MMKKKTALRDNVVSLLLGFAGQSNTLTIPRPFINLCNGDHLAALLLSQILYWQERTEDKAGWFAKSYEDWYDELGLTEYQVKRIIQSDKRNKNQMCKLSDLGIETSLRRSKFYKGAATLHYRVNMAVFQKRVLNIVQNDDPSNVQNDDANIVPERITTETIAETITIVATDAQPSDLTPEQEAVKRQAIDEHIALSLKRFNRNDDLEAMQTLVTRILDIGGVVAASYAKMLLDRPVNLRGNQENKFNDYRIPGGLTPQEFENWYTFYVKYQQVKGGEGNIKLTDKLHSYIMSWVAKGKPDTRKPKPTNGNGAHPTPADEPAAMEDFAMYDEHNQYVGMYSEVNGGGQ